jgi:signal transduction histidine kinase
MAEQKPEDTVARRGFGLSARLLLLTIAFVMLAEVLIFVPSIANFRNNWLNDRLASARTAALVLEAAPDDALPEDLVKSLLTNVGAETIALRIKGTRRLLAINDMPPPIAASYDMREIRPLTNILNAFETLFAGSDRSVGIIGAAPMEGEFLEIVIKEKPLRAAMLRFAANILALSLFISGLTAAMVFVSLKWLIVRPVEDLTRAIVRFAEKPEDRTRIVKPSGRLDEIGSAETAVFGMQKTISKQLKQKKHLTSLGLAVSKINHDLRNMLTSAQLISDRLGEVKDPTVQRFAPKLVQTLDRAIAFCQSTLVYGRADERPPELHSIALREALEEVRDMVGLTDASPIHWQNRIPARLTIVADPEHLSRICTNLCRNGLQAMENWQRPDRASHVLSVDAGLTEDGWWIEIGDTGPGIPAAIRQKLFDAFHGSTNPGGSGLGLAIAADLVRAHGGAINLIAKEQGAHFRISLPRPG